MRLSVRPLEKDDIHLIFNYWTTSTEAYLRGMGADKSKLPSPNEFKSMLEAQLGLPFERKQGFALIWEINGEPSGHSNINAIEFGKEAKMHLHLWEHEHRQSGAGTTLVKKSLPLYFENFKLQKLICEPFAHNPAPNRVLEKVGFKFIRTYKTIPGSINYEQEVNRWEISKEDLPILPPS